MCQLQPLGLPRWRRRRSSILHLEYEEMEMTVARPDTQPASDSPRFPFGRNWASFLGVLSEARIQEAERSLREMLGARRISGATLLDAGSGSGLFSLAAMRLGARRVHSFDFDAESVAC